MSEAEATPDLLKDHLQSQASLLAESLSQCMDLRCNLAITEDRPWDADQPPEEFSRSGLIVYLSTQGKTLLVVIPSGPLLPAWVPEPNLSQQARLETLAMEWSLNAFPEEMASDLFGTVRAGHLLTTINRAQPSAGMRLYQALATFDGQTSPLYFCWWVEKVPTADAAPAGTSNPFPLDGPPDGNSPPGAGSKGAPAASDAPTPPARSNRLSRLLGLPVPVIVKLAEKKIEVGQLMVLTPGTIITFEKSCEDLLDLYVNNSLYARGEAVKIGEKFGLKVNEVGSAEERLSAILQPSR